MDVQVGLYSARILHGMPRTTAQRDLVDSRSSLGESVRKSARDKTASADARGQGRICVTVSQAEADVATAPESRTFSHSQIIMTFCRSNLIESTEYDIDDAIRQSKAL
jgi:hypothetical protein